MPFVNKSPLNYPLNTSSSIRIFKDDRAPTDADFKNFIVGDEWWDTDSNDFWKLVFKDSTQGTWRKMAGTSAASEFFTPDVGGQVGPDILNNINLFGGTGVTTVGTPASNLITINVSGGGITWSRVAGPAVALEVDNGYIPTNAGLVTLTLPATAVVGTLIQIMGEGAGGWSIAQNALQSIQFANLSTTVGIGGSLDSSNRWDAVKIVCRVTDLTWSVSSNEGVLNVV